MAKLKQSSVAVSIVTLGGTVLEHHVTAGMKVGGLAQKVAASLNTSRDQIDLLQEDEGSQAGSRSVDGTEPVDHIIGQTLNVILRPAHAYLGTRIL